MIRVRSAGITACMLAAGIAGTASAQQHEVVQRLPQWTIQSDGHTRIADPKLDGGGAEASFHVSPVGASLAAKAEIHDGGGLVKSLWTGTLSGGAPPTVVGWDGTDAGGNFVDTGDYTLLVGPQVGGGATLSLPITVVRLGITEIEFQDSGANDEFQMVYFKKNTLDGQFYATPAIHEYFNTGDPGDVSDLDLNDGSPRDEVGIHVATDEPVMDGSDYEVERYNYPVAYLTGSTPRIQATFGTSGTTAGGASMAANYPVAGYDLRAVASYQIGGSSTSGVITPGGDAIFDGPTLPADAGRYPIVVTWTWQYAATGSGTWSDVAGSSMTRHRVYTLIDEPNFKIGASGTQYTGPWVEIADKFATWKQALGTDTSTSDGVVETFVKGYFGQTGGIPTAIEGVVYDAYPLGGDGGATHYYQSFQDNMDYSALLNNKAKGQYVNCTDNMGGTTTGLAMLGVDGMRPVRLGAMTLKAIWGIGSPDYTVTLWGSSHSFSYHHICTRTDGVTVIDTCMNLDEDGAPGTLPGLPGWNIDRPWAGIGGYDDLSAYNTVTTSLEQLPGLL